MVTDITNAVRFEAAVRSRILFVSFASIQLGRNTPRYEWSGQFAGYPVNRLYLRDPRQFYYQYGLDGASDLSRGVADLRQTLSKIGAGSTAFIGGSSGGLAALVMGNRLRADEVHVFAPVTYLPSRTPSEAVWNMLRGNRTLARSHLRQYYRIYMARTLDRHHADSRSALANDNGHTAYHIYYGRDNRMDRRHAEYLAGLPGVVLHACDYDQHDLPRHLRDTGQLRLILDGIYKRLGGKASETGRAQERRAASCAD